MDAERFNPFPGLRSFEPEEEHLFFGREEQVDELLARLHHARLLTVVGSSGSGKSSIVRSGVIPALYGGYVVAAGARWRIASFRPGDDPIGNLAGALAAPAVLGGDGRRDALLRPIVEASLRRSGRGLVEAVREARLPAHDNLLILVDQFEELFRFKRSARRGSGDDAAAFVRLLLQAAEQSEVPIYLILTLRSDFLDDCVAFQGLPEAVNRGQYLVPRMTREQQRLAITGPVAVAGAAIAPRLVLRLLNDVGDDPDQLPILQHSLMRTWDYWEGHHADGEPLDLPHYEAIGTMREALSQHAEEAYLDLDDERLRRSAEMVFKALTEIGPQGKGIRRPTTVGEISELGEVPVAEVIAAVEPFRAVGRTFVVPPSRVALGASTVLDISHESLMRIWTRLRTWVAEEAAAADLYRRLAEAAAHHQDGRGGLWRDPELQLALRWRNETQPTAGWALRYDPSFARAMIFLELSREERRRYIELKDRQQRRRLVRFRLMLIAAAVTSLALLVLGLLAFDAKQKAEESRAVALQATASVEAERDRAREQAAIAEREGELARAAEAQAEAARAEAEAARLTSLRQEEIALRERGEALRQQELAAVQARQALAAKREAESANVDAEAARRRAEDARAAAERSAAEARRLRLGAVARSIAVQVPRLRQAGRRELAALAAKHAYDLNLGAGSPPGAEVFDALLVSLEALDAPVATVFAGHRDAVRALAVAPDGRLVATGGDDGSVRVVDLAAPAPQLREVAAAGGMVRAVAFDRDGGLLAAGTFAGSVALWTVPGFAPARIDLAPPGGAVLALAFSPAEDLLAVGGAEGGIALWDLAASTSRPLAAGPGAKVTGLAFSPAGDRLAAGSADGRVRVWATAAFDAPPREAVCPGGAAAVAWDRSGEALAAGGADGSICLWRRAAAGALAGPALLVGHLSSVNRLDFSPDGATLASASSDGTVRLWSHREESREPVVIRGHASWVWATGFALGGARVVSGGADRTVRVWHVRADELAAQVCRHVDRNMTAEEWRELVPEQDLDYQPTCPAPGTGG
jgi:WD40 repeat protein